MPRKTYRSLEGGRKLTAASMRPRPDAAENQALQDDVFDEFPASMRPRPDAAENDTSDEELHRHFVASMRPRPDAAENDRPRFTGRER